MDFALSDEQRELGTVVRSLLGARCAESEVRRWMDDERGWDLGTWAELASAIGVQGLAIPESYGGAGYGPVELGVVFEEAGRALYGGPLLSCAGLAASTLLASGDEEACKDLLPGVAAGETVVTLALTEDSGAWTEAAVTATAEHTARGWRLTGDKTYVLDGHTADVLLVVARSAAGVGVFAVEAPATDSTPLPTLDRTRKQARVELRGAPGRLVGEEGGGWAAVGQALRVGAVLMAAEQVGGAGRVLDMAVAYAKDRHQFGRPIASFQAVKHKCATMLLQLEGPVPAALHGLWAAASAPDELPVAAAVAKAACSEAYSHCAAENVQIHGGIGYTWEHAAHLYLKRAKTSESMLGSPAFHRARLAELIGI